MTTATKNATVPKQANEGYFAPYIGIASLTVASIKEYLVLNQLRDIYIYVFTTVLNQHTHYNTKHRSSAKRSHFQGHKLPRNGLYNAHTGRCNTYTTPTTAPHPTPSHTAPFPPNNKQRQTTQNKKYSGIACTARLMFPSETVCLCIVIILIRILATNAAVATSQRCYPPESFHHLHRQSGQSRFPLLFHVILHQATGSDALEGKHLFFWGVSHKFVLDEDPGETGCGEQMGGWRLFGFLQIASAISHVRTLL